MVCSTDSLSDHKTLNLSLIILYLMIMLNCLKKCCSILKMLFESLSFGNKTIQLLCFYI